MQVFVIGGTGVLGRPTIRDLVRRGHDVRGLARSAGNEATLSRLGAKPVRGDLFDLRSLTAAVAGAEAVLHLATRIPDGKRAGQATAWVENDRIRAQGTRHVLDAARAARVRVIVYPSVCFGYADAGSSWIDATSARLDPPPMLESNIEAEALVEQFTTTERRGVVLRMGYFYGPEAGNTRDAVALARRGVAAVIGAKRAYLPQIWVDDAAAAVSTALHAPAGIYDVVDDEPLPRNEVVALMARAVGRRWLVVPPTWLMLLLSRGRLRFAMRSLRVSNRRFRQATGWAPAVRSARDGWARLRESLA